ncbi:uncharacterized protein Z519_07844 [Cladophialophora bantiana CBS 173.52]|uniref:Core domain-containing protein n=1 Tax=Cladophialophora bantiana (strain ATCC 10958 / CBS 173.52 / CDC B-1940 / NIH 8579) TaxID=1442370 RepID=A0A0D2I4R7_CLAB1|nr:uncharacterized protein Z519_07844 [Cladophialophora bantiana CBS 173.52]KIW91874.1 hypothetical protein Z519_07844 [Cladophialophora bantiana CBS 173.52]
MSQNSMRLAFRAARPLRRPQDATAYLRACRAISNASLQQMTNPRRANPCRPIVSLEENHLGQRRNISSTSIRPATVVVQNPRVDEDGKEMTITISERAAKRLKQITSAPRQKNTLTSSSSSPSPQDSHLRVTVTSGGCHGFQYLMSLEDSSKIDAEEDTIFSNDDGDETARTTGSGKAEVVMDSASLELLKGSTIDFTQELIGSQFKVVGNPRATTSCGCGTSFDIE